MSHIVFLSTGHQVRFNLRGRKYDSRHFKDHGKAEEFLASLPIDACKRSIRCDNTSGMAGIRVEWRLYKSDSPHPALAVSYRKRGRACATSISLNKHGIDGALVRALELRGEPEKLAEYLPIVMSAPVTNE